MKKAMQDVLAFHRKFGCCVGTVPKFADEKTMGLRISLIVEEVKETIASANRGDLADFADGLADLVYVTVGAAISCGIDLSAVWDQVQKANMAKTGGAVREDGKILKPEGWLPPQVGLALQVQGPLALRYPGENET